VKLRAQSYTLGTKPRSVKTASIGAFAVIALAWMLACVALYDIMRQPPEIFARFMARIPGPVAFLVLPFETLWTHARAGNLQVGDSAPDFSLMKLDKSASVQLSTLTKQGQPVALIFGSYT
jgi:hypothetical protein